MGEKIDKTVLDSSKTAILNKLLADMKYGTITIVVQDGKIIQIDKTEKFRL